MADTKIEWATRVWNPIVGCTHAGSPGCDHCYARELHTRRHKAFLSGKKMPRQYAKPFSEIQLMKERLDMPLHWRKPQRIFVNSMSDLFHEDVPFDFISDVFAMMAICQQHTFIVLTKRPQRMKRYFTDGIDGMGPYHSYIGKAVTRLGDHPNIKIRPIIWPMKNVWLGVTAENQEMADLRISFLLKTPAAVRLVSCEPMLGFIYAKKYMRYRRDDKDVSAVDLVISGPETGPKARTMEYRWIEDLYAQCKDAGVPFFDKKNTLGLNLQQFPEASHG
jgi:protein gp37